MLRDQNIGILLIILCSIIYWFSWKSQKKGQYNTAILLLLLGGLILRFYTASDPYLHSWDERYHALVAKNLMQHPFLPTLYENPILPYDFKSWISSHVWVHKQPLPLWSIALSFSIFGVNEIALRLPSILLTTMGIGLTYCIAKYFFNQRIAFVAAFFYSINGLIIELTAGRVATDHIDIFFLFFVQFSIYCCIKFAQNKKLIFNLLAAVALAFAILSKWLPALIVLPIWLLLVLESQHFSRKQIISSAILFLSITCLLFLPWQWYIFSAFPKEASWEASFNLKHFTEVLDGRDGGIFYFLNKIRQNYGELIYLPLLWFLWQLYKDWSNKKLLAIAAWFFVPLIFFSLAKTKMQGYLLFTSPALFLMTAGFYLYIEEFRKKPKWKIFAIAVQLLLIALPIRYTIERIKPFGDYDRNPAWVQELKALDQRNIENGVLLNYNRPIEAMFYTDLVAYAHIPTTDQIKELQKQGYQILINNKNSFRDKVYLNAPDSLKNEVLKLENIEWLNFNP